MPLAGILFWSVAAIAGRILAAEQVAYLVGFGSGAIFPLALLIDKLRGRRPQQARPLVACAQGAAGHASDARRRPRCRFDDAGAETGMRGTLIVR
jgi:cyanate permease